VHVAHYGRPTVTFRAARRFKILPPRLKGAAGPNPDPEGDDEGSDAKLIPIPAIPEVKPPPEENDEVSDAELIPIPAIPEVQWPHFGVFRFSFGFQSTGILFTYY
jgi:hypothetical protein